MRRNLILTAVCAAAVMPVACTGDTAPALTVERTDSAGILIVTTAGADHELDWRIEEVLTIDSESAEAGVFEPTSAGVGADDAGRVHALDRRGGRVVVFDGSGRFVHSLGGRGGGPGEFSFALAMVVAANGSAAVYDGAKQRLVWFARDGSILPERELGEPFFGGRMVQTDAGLLYDRRRAGGNGPPMAGVALAAGGTVISLFERAEPPTKPIQLESCGMGFSGMSRIFEPSVRWGAQGTLIAAVTEAEYDVRVFESSREFRRIRRAIEPRAATAELAGREIGDGMRVGTEGGERVCRTDEVVEKRGFAPVIPAVGRIAMDTQGSVWVLRGGVTGEARPIDVFAADGAYLGTLPAETPFPSAFLPDGRYAAVVSDELDVTRIVIMRVHAPTVSAPERT